MTDITQVIAEFVAPSPPSFRVKVTANEKAVVWRGGRVVDMFSGDSRQVPRDAEVVVASLRVFRWSPDTVSVSFRLADRRSNVEELLGVNTRRGDRITVEDVTDSADLAALVRNSVARSVPESELSAVVGRALNRYGLSVESVRLNEVAINENGNGPPTPPRCTSLHESAKNGDIECVIALIAAGANVNDKDKLGNTPLHDAAWRDEIEIMRALIAAGADIHAKNCHDNTPLHDAARNGKTNAAIALIDAGANIHAKGIFGNTPLHTAAWYGNTATALALISRGANLNAKNRDGYTPEQDARRNRKHKTADALRDAAKRKNNHINTQLRDAIRYDKTETALDLIAAGADVNASVFGFTLLHTATWRVAKGHGDARVVYALIAAGARVNAKGKDGWTPLYVAAFDDGAQVAQILIDAGADVHAEVDDGSTPLHAAASKGHTEVALVLIAAGADIHAMDYDGNTPVQSALTNGHIRTAEAMIAAANGGITLPPNGEFWVKEDDPTNRARVHKRNCQYCNPGRITKPDNRWHGPFASRGDAFAAMRTLGRRDAGGCGICKP